MKRIKLRGHHIGEFAKEYWERGSQERGISAIYGEEMGKRIIAIYYKIIENPFMEIEIVNGLDSICTILEPKKCPMFQSERMLIPCIGKIMEDEDRINLEAYKLKSEHIYSSRMILEMVEKFTFETGFRSIRDMKIKDLKAKLFIRDFGIEG